ncbi:MAG: hypothetical protein ACOYM5_02935 [Caulobacter sp.]
MSEERDIVSILNAYAQPDIGTALPHDRIAEAASEIQRLRGEVSRLSMTLEAEEAGQLVAVDFIDNEHADEVQRLRGEVERLRSERVEAAEVLRLFLHWDQTQINRPAAKQRARALLSNQGE